MRSKFFSSISAALAGLLALAHSSIAFSQSLSIRKDGSNYVVEAAATAENPGTLQITDNLRLWIDVHENLQEPQTVTVDAAGESQRYFRLKPSVEPAPPIRVMVIGDSMASDWGGWGSGLPTYFKPSATIINYAQPWTSTKVFLQSAEMEKMLLVEPDYVFINFAWSDGGEDPSRGSPGPEFMQNLRTIISSIRGFNGVPILVTLHAGRFWDAQGKLDPWEHPYNALMRQVAAEVNVPLVDLYRISWDLINKLGPEGSAFINLNPDDKMHTSPLGAKYLCRLMLRSVPEAFTPYLKGIFDAPPTE